MRASIVFVTAAAVAGLMGCADGDPSTTTRSTPVMEGASSPCKGTGPDVLLCADFDDGSVSTLNAVGFGGGTLAATAAQSVSAPYSLHVRTVSGTEAAAALVLTKTPFAVPKIQVDADVLVVPNGSADAVGGESSSLLRLPVMDQDAAIGAFYVHYVKSSRELFLVAHSEANGDVGRVPLGTAPGGFFHLTVEVAPAGGGGVFAQAKVDDRSAKTVTINATPNGPLQYSLEAGLDVPAASPFEAYLDNVMVRAR
jgi:hypothetical protein